MSCRKRKAIRMRCEFSDVASPPSMGELSSENSVEVEMKLYARESVYAHKSLKSTQ